MNQNQWHLLDLARAGAQPCSQSYGDGALEGEKAATPGVQ